MKKTNYKSAFLLVMMVLTYNCLKSQDRGSVWVHGLNSGADDWLKYEQLFKAERQLFDQVTGATPRHYFTNGGVKSTASQVYTSYSIGRGGQNNRTIYVGHSNGGVVGRELDVNPAYSNSLGGIITFGSPLDGAKIANTSENGQADNFVNDGVDKITRGPVRQLYYLNEIANLLGWDAIALLQTTIRSSVIPSNPAADIGQQDLKEGSAYMNSGVRDVITTTPKIHVYGNENGPVLWHYLTSYENIGAHRPLSDDTQFVNLADLAGDIYNDLMWVNIALAVETGWFTFGIGGVYYGWIANGWAEGRDWFRYDAENGWNSLIGSGSTAFRSVCYEAFQFGTYQNCLEQVRLDPRHYEDYDCANPATYTQCDYYYSPVNGQSDGFIKAPSATGYNSDWSNNATKIEALGVNHIEMLDNPRIEKIFRDIFNGTAGADPSFRTDPR